MGFTWKDIVPYSSTSLAALLFVQTFIMVICVLPLLKGIVIQ